MILNFFAAALILFTACDKVKIDKDSKKKDKVLKSDLELVSEHKLDLPEPSGLALSADGQYLWTVSDHTGKIYKISLSGEIADEIDIKGTDLEGITAVGSDKLAVVFEKKREILIIDEDGNKIKQKKIELSDEPNLGIEGITYNSSSGNYFVVNEKSPMLIIELDGDLNVVGRKEMNFSSDLSSICYDKDENVFWVTSHESKMLAKLDDKLNVIDTYNIPLKQAEGVAIDNTNKLIYAVSDVEDKLFIFNMK